MAIFFTRSGSAGIAIATLTAVAFAHTALAQADKPQDETPVFRSDIAMGRVDAQVVDRYDVAVSGLTADDFVLRYRGETIPIRQFQYENMPMDVVLLLDVSGSMRPQIEHVASASHRALAVLGKYDRVGIMTFTTRSSVRLKLSGDRDEVERKLDDIVGNASFGGGTDINGALLEAAAYLGKEGRRDARRAIVIVTDDIAKPCDQLRVSMALSEADALVMALLAPQVFERNGPYGSPAGRPPVLGPWPGGGGPLGGVIWGPRRGPMPGGPPSVPADMPSAGTANVARDSGGESLPVNDASTLETTFARIRKRYAIYYYLPEGASATTEDTGVQVDLTRSARTLNPDGELRYRQVFLAGSVRRTFVRRVVLDGPVREAGAASGRVDSPVSLRGRRRVGVDEGGGPRVAVVPVETRPTVEGTASAEQPLERQRTGPRRAPVSEPRGPRVSSLPGRGAP